MSKVLRVLVPILMLVSLASAQIVVNEVMQNPGAVGDDSGEWFELYNAGEVDVDMVGWTISDYDNDSFTIEGELVIPVGGFLVFGNNGDMATNGGVEVDYVYGDFFLSNSTDELVITDTGGREVDNIQWDNGATFPDPNGASMYLVDPSLDNADGANWAEATEPWPGSAGDFGTPGFANPVANFTELQNGGFENWDVNGAAGPPDFWTLVGDNVTAEQYEADVYEGNYAVMVPWTDDVTKELEQDVYEPIIGETYQFGIWAMDNEAQGYVEIALKYKDGDGTILAEYFSDGSADDANWQELTVSGEAVEGAVYATLYIYFYASEGWIDGATVFVDDASYGLAAGGETFTIEELQTNENLLETVVITAGIVTQPANSAHVGYTDVYIQDETGYGINVYSPDPLLGDGMMRGDLVQVTGTLIQYYDITEITDFTWELISQGNPMPEPIEYTTADFAANAIAMEGAWAVVTGIMQNDPEEGSFNLLLDDGSGPCSARINGDAALDFGDAGMGSEVTIYGVIDAYRGEPQLTPSLQEDLVFGEIPEITSIEEVQTNEDLQGTEVTVVGIVTQPANSCHTGYVDVYIQDDSGYGVVLYDPDPLLAEGMDRGDMVSVTGTVGQYFDVTQIVDFTWEQLSEGNPLPEPIVYTTGDFLANGLAMEGSWATVAGILENDPGEGSYSLTVNDGTGGCTVRINGDANLDLTEYVAGDEVQFFGTIDTYQGVPQLQPCLQEDIVPIIGPELVSIETVQTQDMVGQEVIIEGVVTQAPNTCHVAYVDMYIQDESGYGVLLYDPDPLIVEGLVRGDRIQVTGTVDQYYDVTEIVSFTWELISQGNPIPAPIEYTTGDFAANAIALEGAWATVTGTLMDAPGEGGYNLSVDDGSGPCTVRINGDANLDLSMFDVGSEVTFLGTIDAYRGAPQLQPSQQEDIIGGGAEPGELVIPLQATYFELVSTNLLPADLTAEAVFGGIADLAIVYQNDGGIYIPEVLNSIGEINVTEGYRVFCTAASELVYTGQPIDVATTEYNIVAGPWNWLGYGLADPMDAEMALADFADDIVIIQADDGSLWIPGVLNTIGDLTPGTGYMVIVTNDVAFYYNEGAGRFSSNDVIEMPEVEGAPQPTGLPYSVLVSFEDDIDVLGPSVIEIYDGNLLVGKSVVLEDNEITPVTAWMGDIDHDVEGFTAGNTMTINVLDANGSVIASNRELHFAEGAYASVTMNGDDSLIPNGFAIDSIYPNPFNPVTTVQVSLPVAANLQVNVFNVMGEKVAEIANGFYSSGHHSLSFRAGDLASGMYFIQAAIPGETTSFRKVMLLK